MVWVKLDGYMEKNETWSLSVAMHKTQLQMHKRSQHKTQDPKLLENEVGNMLQFRKGFLNSTAIKNKK